MDSLPPLFCPLPTARPPAPEAATRPAEPRRQRLSVMLRDQTRAAHLTAESALDLDRWLVDRRSYGALLLALRSFYAPTEHALAALAGWDGLRPVIDIGSRRRVALLDDDLRRLGVTVPGGAVFSTEPRVLQGLSSGLGCLYVLEGSALGGRVIARRAQAALGAGLPVAFFSSVSRPDPGGDWRALQAALDAFSPVHPDAADGRTRDDEVIRAARRTFASFAAAMVRSAPPR